MPNKRFSAEQVVTLLRQIDLLMVQDSPAATEGQAGRK